MKVSKLSDTQLVLLNAAAQRENGSLLPAPEVITAKAAPQLKKALESLLNRKLIVEQNVTAPAETWRDKIGQRVGLVITDAGRVEIGVGGGDLAYQVASEVAQQSSPASLTPTGGARSHRSAKQAQLIEMLARSEGASIDEITAATSWLPHSARAMLTGLRRRGFTITSEKAEGGRRYHATAPEAPL